MISTDVSVGSGSAYNYPMVGMLVPLKGGIGSIFHPPGSARTISGSPKWYFFLPVGGWGMPPTTL